MNGYEDVTPKDQFVKSKKKKYFVYTGYNKMSLNYFDTLKEAREFILTWQHPFCEPHPELEIELTKNYNKFLLGEQRKTYKF